MELAPRLSLINWLAEPGPDRRCRERPHSRLLRALPGRPASNCRAASSSSIRCTRFSRAAGFAGTISRPTRAKASNTDRPARAMPRKTGGDRPSITCSKTARTRCRSISPNAPRSTSRDRRPRRAKATGISWPSCTGSARPAPSARWTASIPIGRRGAPKVSASRSWRRCATWCRCWGSRSSRPRKWTSRARSAGSISGATPPSR